MTHKMSTRSSAGQVPAGVADYFWADAFERRSLEATLLNVFRGWGYGDVVTPAFEYAETLGARGSSELQSELCRFLDRDGSMLALRADMTIPVARLVATRLHDAPMPQRYCYAGSVFRDAEPRAGQQREFWQAGVELLGSTMPDADAEVLALTARALDAAGIEQYRLVLGQMQYFDGLLQALQLTPEQRVRLAQAIDRNSEPELEAFLRETPLPRRQQRALDELPRLGGIDIDGILARAAALSLNRIMVDAVTNLRAICEVLAALGVLGRVTLDLSEIHNLGYYTGITFEALAPGVGFRIASGGRYDNLVGTFGAPMPAVGAALGLERVLLARRLGAATPAPHPPAPDLLISTANRPDALALAAALRGRGYIVTADLEHRRGDALCAHAARVGARAALDCTAGVSDLYDLRAAPVSCQSLSHETALVAALELMKHSQVTGDHQRAPADAEFHP